MAHVHSPISSYRFPWPYNVSIKIGRSDRKAKWLAFRSPRRIIKESGKYFNRFVMHKRVSLGLDSESYGAMSGRGIAIPVCWLRATASVNSI